MVELQTNLRVILVLCLQFYPGLSITDDINQDEKLWNQMQGDHMRNRNNSRLRSIRAQNKLHGNDFDNTEEYDSLPEMLREHNVRDNVRERGSEAQNPHTVQEPSTSKFADDIDIGTNQKREIPKSVSGHRGRMHEAVKNQ